MARNAKAVSKGRKLSNFLCFAVYSANLAFGRAYKPLLDKVGLTYTQYIALVALSDEDELTVSALGEKLFLESNTLTPILKKLEQMGYLKRHRDPADERQVRVSLTPHGAKTDRAGPRPIRDRGDRPRRRFSGGADNGEPTARQSSAQHQGQREILKRGAPALALTPVPTPCATCA